VEEIIRPSHYYFLGTNPEFRAWLAGLNFALFKAMMDKLGKRSSCKAVDEIMAGVVRELAQSPSARVALVDFVSRQFPAALARPATDVVRSARPTLRAVPSSRMVTLPMRRVLKGPERMLELQRLRNEHRLLFDVSLGEEILVEWVPDRLAHLAERIPDEAWWHKRVLRERAAQF
jgi:hypothetical protein